MRVLVSNSGARMARCLNLVICLPLWCRAIGGLQIFVGRAQVASAVHTTHISALGQWWRHSQPLYIGARIGCHGSRSRLCPYAGGQHRPLPHLSPASVARDTVVVQDVHIYMSMCQWRAACGRPQALCVKCPSPNIHHIKCTASLWFPAPAPPEYSLVPSTPSQRPGLC